MWLAFGLTIIIGASWFTKMIIQKKILFYRTPLDIPIILFLTSQIISTIFSLDTHVSIWGYYSRFNGGLLSIISYIFLYYAFMANFFAKAGAGPQGAGSVIVKRLIFVSLFSGIIVALWGLPSHFGYDPTCYLFTKPRVFDVSCWTNAFQPMIRIFSTLGQPDWLAAYLVVLLPLLISFFITSLKTITEIKDKFLASKKNILLVTCYLLLITLFYADLVFTDSRSGFIAFWVANIFLFAGIFLTKILERKIFLKCFLILTFSFLLFNFFNGFPVPQLDRFTLREIKNGLSQNQTAKKEAPIEKKEKAKINEPSILITDSTKIRFIVWKGAIEAFKHNPVFGSGVETFAFIYYKYRPAEHNMISEWDYLYNKAHNEYLNYLATTGIFGLGSYLLMVGTFLIIALRTIFNFKYQITTNVKTENKNIGNWKLEIGNWKLLSLALLATYIGILVVNFFGFSVVIVNLYFFLIPAFVFVLLEKTNQKEQIALSKQKELSSIQKVIIALVILTALYLILALYRFWIADKAYSLGANFVKLGQYQESYLKLNEAISERGSEPVFKDEFSYNTAVLAVAFENQKQTSIAAQLINQTLNLSGQVTAEHPNNVVFWKTRVRAMYTLAQIDPNYLLFALEAIKKANELAPTDAKISYNLGLLYQQTGDTKNAVATLENTVKLKPDYRDAYYALGIYYHELSINKNGKVADINLHKKAVETMNFILKNLSGKDADALQALKTWGEI
ncbi:MAG: O-antigen ligase family protein [Candidatus Berkelbacteria bacterium]|nr:O-antigen ligase family protein [Candidatus Berkelbacteria bacterium]